MEGQSILTADFTNSTERHPPQIADYQLETLTYNQRLIFTVLTSVFLFLSVAGNVATIYATIKRNIRPFFRACLISLACSDLLMSVFTSANYLSVFSTPYIQIWRLGGLMCSLSPFITTTALLVNSMTLVSIALDRYMAIIKLIRGAWEPGGVLSSTCFILIWGLSSGISSPMISTYQAREFTILKFGKNRTHPEGTIETELCATFISEKESNLYYFIVIFSVVFLPMVIAFVWLNSFIAREIWIRRRGIPSKRKPTEATIPAKLSTKSPNSSCEKRTTSETNALGCGGAGGAAGAGTTTSKNGSGGTRTTTNDGVTKFQFNANKRNDYAHETIDGPRKPNERETRAAKRSNGCNGCGHNNDRYTSRSGHVTKRRETREIRQLRIFGVILALMAVFIFCRLPSWLYLILRLSHEYPLNMHYVLHFSLGILSLSSCFLNPLFYTFLNETIQYTIAMTKKIKYYCGLPKLCSSGANKGSKCAPGNGNNREIYTIFRG